MNFFLLVILLLLFLWAASSLLRLRRKVRDLLLVAIVTALLILLQGLFCFTYRKLNVPAILGFLFLTVIGSVYLSARRYGK